MVVVAAAVVVVAAVAVAADSHQLLNLTHVRSDKPVGSDVKMETPDDK